MDTIKNKFQNMIPTNMISNQSAAIIFLFAGLFILIAYLIYRYFILPKINPDYVVNNEYDTENTDDVKKAKISFFYADWCPHCKKAMPEWDSFINDIGGSSDFIKPILFNGVYLLPEKIDCTNINNLDSSMVFIGDNNTPSDFTDQDKAVALKARELVEKYNIEGFPTILIIFGDEVVDFDSKITKESLKDFINQIIKK